MFLQAALGDKQACVSKCGGVKDERTQAGSAQAQQDEAIEERAWEWEVATEGARASRTRSSGASGESPPVGAGVSVGDVAPC